MAVGVAARASARAPVLARARARALTLALTLALVLAAALAAGCAGSDPAAAPTPPPATTLEYAAGQSADLYLPRGRGAAPVVVLVPGGGWQSADPAGLAGLAARLATAGMVAAPVRIRAAADGVVYPAPVEDVACAVSTVVDRARSLGFAPGPVVVLGHSSGAHLAALAALAPADYADGCAAPTVAPDALVGLSGPYDVTAVPDLAQPLFGDAPDEDPAAWAEANPVARATLRPELPVLLLHGEDDEVVPPGFTTDFAAALEQAGHPTTTRLLPGVDHQEIFTADVAAGPVTTWIRGLARAARPSGRQ